MKNHAQKDKPKQHGVTNNHYYIYGRHAVLAAISNPNRTIHKIFVASDEYSKYIPAKIENSKISKQVMSTLLPTSAVHQNIAALVSPLKKLDITDITKRNDANLIVILDNVTDPHNIGAILRSSGAFGAACLVVTDINSPHESGTIAKSSSGAIEVVPVIRVTNLASTIKQLKSDEYWVIGLDGYANITLEKTPDYKKIALVMGSEGKGLRNLTKKLCDLTVKLDISENVESLNVSNAAAIALYHFAKIVG
jgi:23S rRNA (guanosine2251-2'-O)-methyltransferase